MQINNIALYGPGMDRTSQKGISSNPGQKLVMLDGSSELLTFYKALITSS